MAFFAYPDKPSLLLPPDCEVLTLADPAEDGVDAIERLADAARRRGHRTRARAVRPSAACRLDPITLPALAAVIAALMPEQAIVVDESITSGRGLLPATQELPPPHDWLTNPGGSIGTGLPLAVGAAVACPDRKVVCLESDGSGMYTRAGRSGRWRASS